MILVTICLVIPQRMRLSGTVTEIWHLKDNGVTILTFWGHQGGHSLGREKFKDFSRTLNSLFQTYSVDVSAKLQRF